MSNPNNETSAYNFPPQGQNPNNARQGWQLPSNGWNQQTHGQPRSSQPGNGWGQPPQQPQKKRKNRAGIIVLLILLIVALLAVAAEFGVRAYLKNQMVTTIKEQAAANDVSIEQDPEVSFGTSPVLLGLLTSTIGQLDMTVPSSLDVSYPDGDKSNPEVKGNPEIIVHGRDLKIDRNNTENMTVGDLTVNVTMPSELILAEAAKAAEQNAGDASNPLQGALTVTDVTPNTEEQVLEFEIADGLMGVKMKPIIDDGNMTFEVEGAQLFGFNLPEAFVNTIRDQLSTQAQSIGGNLRFKEVEVTADGVKMELNGQEVNLQELSDSIDSQSTMDSNGQNGGGSGGGGASLTPNPQEEPLGSSEALAA
ncbi:hypothetical protein CUROG_09375 [Corynebacterium urogenitale]|uniref:DUF2993 domain-containing protein n=1 Tax=Corynebacterium urogenitale TaxID=2487892 RepID=A0A5J6ZCM7_9CORY|nr:DUF2993 domain-containing protein [Corynebacterium urogenitale]QFQ03219.1 hypothetical protein CUROG_09375 [Corynebacterium urogenitale]